MKRYKFFVNIMTMYISKDRVSAGASLILAIALVIGPAAPLASAAGNSSTNLISNPSFETANPGDPTAPDHWVSGGYGNNTHTLTYPVPGTDGEGGTSGVAAKVAITSYTDGDVKWVFSNVPVVPGKTYVYTDNYLSNVPTQLLVAYTNGDASSTQSYAGFTTVPQSPATSTWETSSVQFTVPVGVVSVSVYHVLKTVGELTIDNTSLSEVPPPTPFSQGFVSLTFDDGLESQYQNAKPILDAGDVKGTFMIFTHVIAGIGSYSTPTSVLPDTIYAFADDYTSTGPSTVTVQVTNASGTVTNAELFDQNGVDQNTSSLSLPSSNGQSAHATGYFYMPIDAKTVTVSHVASGGGTVTTSNIAFGAEDNMTLSQILSLQSDGQEIGGHTQTHVDLTTVGTSVASGEISGGRQDLLSAGVNTVQAFAYPYGNYDQTVQQATQGAGFTSARGLVPGFNGTNSDPFALQSESVNASTSVSQFTAWIDQAKANKTWLILVFHSIDSNLVGSPYGATPATLQAIVDYMNTNNVPVYTVSQGLSFMQSGTVTPPASTDPTTPPVVATSTPPTDATSTPPTTTATSTTATSTPVVTTDPSTSSGSAPSTVTGGTVSVTTSTGGGGGNGAVYGSSPLAPGYQTPYFIATTTETTHNNDILVSSGKVLGASTYNFVRDLSIGMRNEDVAVLQAVLKANGYFASSVTGYFGPITKSSVKHYQAKHGLPVVGMVGPRTRALLNR